MRNRQQGELEYPSPLVGEDRLGRSPERGGGPPRPDSPVAGGGRLRRCALLGCDGAPCQATPLSARAGARVGSPPQGGRGCALGPAAPGRRRGACYRLPGCRLRAVVLRRRPRPARPVGGREALDRGARSRRPAAAALRDGRTGAGGCRSRRRTSIRASSPCSRPTRTARFDRHPGIDPLALLRAAGQLLAPRPRRLRRLDADHAGGATARAARGAHARAPSCASSCARCSSSGGCRRPEILALYLTLAPYGGNLEGTRAATLAYFGTEPKRLSFAEAALLVALPQAPETRRPDRFAADARRARDRVLDRAVARGVLNAAEARGREGGSRSGRAAAVSDARRARGRGRGRGSARTPRSIGWRSTRRLQASLETLVRERARADRARSSPPPSW